MNIQLKAKRQDGFTIIELVVVILLLGILAATALPRFLDVTDEAHAAAVEGVEGGLSTGVALFRATWVATGQPTSSAVTDFGAGTLFANTSGYPIGLDATIDASTCKEVFDGVLQGGRPLATAGAAFDTDGGGDDEETIVEAVTTATPATEFVAVSHYDATDDVNGDSTNDVADTTICGFYYVGQYASGTATDSHNIPRIRVSLLTGDVTVDTLALDSI